MEAQDRIVASVQELLGEVRKLKIERDALQGFNPAKATYLQSQIFRNFGIIEALLVSCSGARKAIGKTVLLSKKELSAGVKELKLMSIPELVTAENVEEWRDGQWNNMVMEPFPFLQLPPEVRRIILGYLTSPRDMVNLATAAPADGHMMEWNLSSLRLELVLPILFARDRKLRYEDTVKLCQASPTLQHVVKNCYKRALDEYRGDYWMHNGVGLSVQHLLQLRASDFSLNPLPTTVKLELFRDREDPEKAIQEHLRVLRQVGANIWSVFLEVRAVLSIQHTLETFRKLLQLTPNLRRLEVQVPHGIRYQDVSNELELDFNLPDLPQLQKLQLETHNSLISSKLLEKYGSVITSIELGYETILPTSPADETEYPHLINFYSFNRREEDVTGMIRRLEPFVGAPLKRITLDGGYSHSCNDAVNFQSVLCALSRFADTLEEVKVEFAYKNSIDHEEVGGGSLDWLANINFPKVKSLKVINLPKTWAFLLKFPALEEFKFFDDIQPDCEHDVSIRNFDSYFDLPDVLELSFVKEKLCVSNIWKIFPFLRRIEIDSWDSGPSQVTRDQCLAFQRKLANVLREVGHVDTCIKGPVKTVVQSTDTTLVVEGNVDGDVIQEGNGCILVNGHVRGNIEQIGDGKIFIRGSSKEN